MIRIYRIQVERFPGVADLTTPPLCTPRGKPTNQILIAGQTGFGKTRLLEAILWGLGLEEMIQQAGLSRLDSPAMFPTGARVQLDVLFAGEHLRFVRQNSGPPTVFFGDDRKSVSTERAKEVQARLASGVLYFSEHRRYRLAGPVSGGEAAGRVTEAKRLRYLKTAILSSNGPSQEKLRALQNAWESCLDDPAQNEFVWKKTPEGDWDLLVRRTKFGDTPTEFSVDQLSAGELDLFVLLGTLLYRQMPLDILLLDKPELYLCEPLLGSFKRRLEQMVPDTQLIFGTDNDQFWDSNYSYERVALLR